MPIYNPSLEQTATLIVAASDSLYAERVDFTCDGTADEVEINAAFALGAADTRVVLLEGTYTLADPIIFTNNNQVLEGQGAGTLIDGDGLATGEHAISITALTNCEVRNLAIQTEDGGGKTCHCIFSEDGCDGLVVNNVVVVDSDSDGIHIEGTDVDDVHIHDCFILDVDDVGIFVDMDAGDYSDRIQIVNNLIESAGSHGIYFANTGAGHRYAVITGNTIATSTQNGMELLELTFSNIVNNIVHTSTLSGILLGAGSNHNNVDNNQVYNNTRHGITIISATENTLTGNNCNGNDSGNTNTYDGINLQLCDYTTLVGNHCYDNDRRGIQIGRSSYCVITGNNCHENTQDDGIYIIGDGTGNADYNVVSGNNCSNNGDDGIEVAQAGATANSNQITGNIVRGNSGTDIVDGGTLTVVKDNDGMVGFGDDQSTTLTVAASDSMQPANADYYCDGTADDVQINAALNALPAAGGRVILLEGTYTIVDTIAIPADDITLEGQGRSTFLDGDGLATTEDAIRINGYSDVAIRNLAIQTQDGGGKDCQCISFNGPASGLVIDGVIIVDSDNYGIEILGGANVSDTRISNCIIEGADLHGIRVSMAGGIYCDRLTIENCIITGCGGLGISLTGVGAGNRYCKVTNNTIHSCGTHGIAIYEADYGVIADNVSYSNTFQGIFFGSSSYATVTGNTCYDNDSGGTTYNGIQISECSHCTIGNNNCRANGLHGIYLRRSSNCTVTGNVCSGQNTGDGILVTGDGTANSDYNIISSNVCEGNGDDGIEIAGGADANSNQVISNMLQGNSGTALVDGGTLTVVKDNEGMAGFGDDKAATLVVAASNSMQPANSDYYCDGTADEVQINAALNALPTDGGRVILLEGTFVTAATITIPDDAITLEGQGRATLIDGDGLAAAVNAITISAKDDVVIKNLAVQTQTGAEPAKGHCVYGENGCDRLLIENVTVVDSGDDGIHLTGTITYDVRIIGCNIMDGDGHGIYLAINPAYRFSLRDNTVKDVRDYGIYIGGNFLGEVTGNNVTDATQAGIFAWAGVNMIITNNTCRSCGTYGIYLNQCPTNTVMGNVCVGNTSHGMYIFRCLYCVVNGNMCYGNGADGINATGDATHNTDYNTLTGNVCTGNADDGIAIEGVGDANKNIVVANNLMGNTGTNFVDNGTATQIGHNVTA